MQENKETGGVTTTRTNPLHEWNQLAFNELDIVSEDVLHLPSPHITPAHMLRLYHHLNLRLEETNADGVVITHGTDTLEETSYAVELLYKSNVPVVFTGAMRSSDELSSDGPRNFITAVRTAASEDARAMGVLVVMNEQIHLAKNVTKSHSSSIEAFQSPDSGPIGSATQREISFYYKPCQREQDFTVSAMDKKVLLIKTYAGMEEGLFQHIISQALDGIVIEALGQGNVPPSLLPSIHSLLKNHIPVVLVTRCFSGSVHDVYSYEGGGKNLKEAGLVFTNGVNGPKARLKLIAALESHFSIEDIRKSFEHH